MPQDIQPISDSPAAFAPLAAKINELVARVNGHANPRVQSPLSHAWSDGSSTPLWTIDINGLIGMMDEAGPLPIPGGGFAPSNGGATLPGGYTIDAFTVCSNGSPITLWWPDWSFDPT